MLLTNYAPTTNLTWRFLEDRDLDPEPFYRKAGIDPELRNNAEARVKTSCVDKLWLLVVEEIKDPCFTVEMINNWHPSQMGALGYAWLVSSTLRRALNRAVRYIEVVAQGIILELEQAPRGLCLKVNINETLYKLPQQYDIVLVILMHMCRYNFGDELIATEIKLTHSKPFDAEKLESYFRTKIIFDANVNSITFSNKDVDAPLSSANRQLVLMNDEVLMKYLIEIKKGDLVEQIKSIIVDRLADGNVSDKIVAQEINMSVRSMQRKLKAMETSFRIIFSDVREMVAIHHIKNPVNNMTDVAFLIGFSEQSAFSRAFKQWTGLSPLKYRESLA